MCTSRAPALRSISTTSRGVFPRTIESSMTTIFLPSMTSDSGFSFMRTPCCRSDCDG